MWRWLGIASLLIMSGCGPSREEMLTRASNDCGAYGYYPNTPEYSQCMMAKDGQYMQMEQQRRQNLARGLENMGRAMNPPTTTCTSERDYAGRVVTNCQ